MGKASLLWVFMASLSLAVLAIGITIRNNQSADVAAACFDAATAHSIAQSSAEIGVRSVLSTPAAFTHDTSISLGSLNGGNSTVAVKMCTADSILLTCTGTYGRTWDDIQSEWRAASDIISVTMNRAGGGAPELTGAMSISAGSRATLNTTGKDTIDGHNYDINGNLDSTHPSVTGISFANHGALNLIWSGVLKVTGSGGGPTPPDTEQVTSQKDYYPLAMSLIPKRDYLFTGNFSTPQVLGTLSSPKITYCTGTTAFSQSVTGVGILIIDGKFSNSGTFKWIGLVIIVGDSLGKELAKITNGAPIIGGLIMTGPKVALTQSNWGNVKYSYDAIQLAFKDVGGSSARFKVAGWWE